MRKGIYDKYIADGWHVFKLYKVAEGKQGNAVKGMYGTPPEWNNFDIPNAPYNANAIYGGSPPPHIMVIDWDMKNGKKQGDVTLATFEENNFVDLTTGVRTPTQGGHIYVNVDKLYVKNPKDDDTGIELYPDIDFIGHGREFVVLGDQVIPNYGEYAMDKYIVDDLITDIDLPQRTEKNEKNEDVYEVSPVMKMMLMGERENQISNEKVDEILELFGTEFSYEEWLSVGFALFDRYLGNDEGRAKWEAFTKSSDKHTEGSHRWSDKWDNGGLKPDHITFKKLLYKADEVFSQKIVSKITDADTLEDVTANISKHDFSMSGAKQRVKYETTIAEAYRQKEKELNGGRLKQLSTVVKELFPAKNLPATASSDKPFIHYNNTGKVLPLLANLLHFVEHHSKFDFRFDVILKRPIINGEYGVETLGQEIAYSRLLDELEFNYAPATTMLNKHFQAMLGSRTINPLINYIEDLPTWDGETDYIGRISKTLKTKHASPDYVRACFQAFTIQAIAAWDGLSRTKHKLSKLESVLVFVGGQGIGKTTWMGKLMPATMKYYFKEGIELDPSDKDSVMEALGAGLVELGELDATTRKADISSLKSFLSKTTDEFRVPYGRTSERYARQTVFTGTVNNPDFLKDATGSRRFLALDVVKLGFPEAEDVKGMWAQAFALYLADTNWLLTPIQTKDQVALNNSFTDIGEVGDMTGQFLMALMQSTEKKKLVSVTKIFKELVPKKTFNARERSDFIALLTKEGYSRNTQGKFYLPQDCFDKYHLNELDITDLDAEIDDFLS